MAHVPSNPRPIDPRRQRAEELLLDRATVGLDAGEHAELELLCAELGIDADDESFDLAAAAFAVAATPQERMPAALRDRIAGTARAMSASDGGVSDAERRELKLVGSEPHRARSQPTRLELVTYKLMAYSGWIAAAASLALAATVYFGRTQPTPDGAGTIAVNSAPREQEAESVDAALARLSKEPTAVHALITEASPTDGPPAPVAEVVFSGDSNEGVMTLTNLPAIETPGDAYQLWVVDAMRDDRYPVDAGTFKVDQSASNGRVKFKAKLPVAYPRAFAITVERAGGNVVSNQAPVAIGGPQTSEPLGSSFVPAPAAMKVAQPIDTPPPAEEMGPPAP